VANTVQQYLAARLVAGFDLHAVPVVLGVGERLLENVGDLKLGRSARSRRQA
jgi:dihydrofolate reductase